ncbi:hypothetical protein [Streptomyces yaizuensis]|uniref:Small hydrophilic protein n=1 Tax=Streptomyces yaizuensis TaxID=2989713 RepID=A0ABQ5P1N8_9ACTN|nr:hypothetical protein [Streptomyces sp. YSPA8]GLF96512.1 hypothetical protein SYYSPA8_19465 [Streptomyces sp. YSPA8]
MARKPAPAGDSMHSPRARPGILPDPQGNRAERRAAEREASKQQQQAARKKK